MTSLSPAIRNVSTCALTCVSVLPSAQGPLVRPNIQLTPLRGGYLTGRPSVVDFGTALNLTRVQLGFNVNVSVCVCARVCVSYTYTERRTHANKLYCAEFHTCTGGVQCQCEGTHTHRHRHTHMIACPGVQM